MLFQKVVRTGSPKGGLPGEDLEQGNPQAVDIRLRRWRGLENLFGRDVGPRSLDHLLFAADQFRHRAGGLRRQREVDQPQFRRLIEKNVVGFDVAMDIALIVQVAESLAELLKQPRDADLE